MNKFLVTASLLLAANIAMAQATPEAAATSATKATPGEPASSAGSINTPIETPTASWRKKLKFQGYYGVWGDVAAVNRGDSSTNGTDVYVQAARDIGNGQSLALRINAAGDQTNENADQHEFVLIDPQVIYKNPFFQSAVRLSFPVTEVSREIGRHELRYNGGMDIVDAGRFTVGAGPELRAYAYTRDDAGQRLARARAIVSPAYKVTDNLSVFSNAIYDVRWNNEGAGYQYLVKGNSNIDDPNGKASPRHLDRRANLELGLSINAFKKALLIEPYVSQVRQFEADGPLQLFQEDETGYNVEFTINL